MKENYVDIAFSKSTDYVETMKADAKRGRVIKEIQHPVDHSIVRIIEVSEGDYIYTLTNPGSLTSPNEPYFYARSNYLIPELVSRTPRFAYDIANASIRRSLKGFFIEYVCDSPFDELSICFGRHKDVQEDEKIRYSQGAVSDDPNVPMFLFTADFVEHSIYYPALATARKEGETFDVRIDVRRLKPDGNPNLEDDISSLKRRYGPRDGMEELTRRRELAEEIFSDFYRSLGLPYKANFTRTLSLEAQLVRDDIFGELGVGNVDTAYSDEPEYIVDDDVIDVEPEFTIDDDVIDVEPEYTVYDDEPVHFLSEGNDMAEDDLESSKKQLGELYKYLDKIKKTGNEKLITVIQGKIDALEAKIEKNKRTRR